MDEKGSAGSRSFQPYSPMGWRVALRSGRVHKLCQRLRSSESRYARHRSHIRQLRQARTIRHGPGRASGRANWCGDGPGRPRPTRGRHTRRPGGRVVCTGIDNPGGNVFPASRPVWQWGGIRYNFYLALRLMRRMLMTPLHFSCCESMCIGCFGDQGSEWQEAVNSPSKVYHLRRTARPPFILSRPSPPPFRLYLSMPFFSAFACGYYYWRRECPYVWCTTKQRVCDRGDAGGWWGP